MKSNSITSIVMLVCAIVVGVYANNNTSLKREIAELKEKSVEITDRKPIEYYCSDGFGDGRGLSINVSQTGTGTEDESVTFKVAVIDSMVLGTNGNIEFFCSRGTPSYQKPGRTFKILR